MEMNRLGLCVSVLALGLLVGTANAGPLITDPNSMEHGSVNFSAEGYTSGVLDNNKWAVGHVEYAVYAPGTAPGNFNSSVALGTPGTADPSNGADYVYAYEIFNPGPATGGLTVLTLTVGLSEGNPLPIGSYIHSMADGSSTTPTNGMAPVFTHFAGTTSAAYTFSGIPLGQNSDILYFVSPYAPMMQSSGLGGGSTAATTLMLPSPNPVPEPSTVVLSAIAAVCLLTVRHLRRRTRSS